MMIPTLALAVAACLSADDVSTKFVASGAMPKMGGYMPIRAEMANTPEIVKKAPKGLVAPKYGKLQIGDKSWAFILDEPEKQPAKLYVDTNNDGDLTNDPPTEWKSQKAGEYLMFNGSSKVDLGDGKLASLGMYRFDPADTRRPALKNTLLFYTDYGFELTLSLDGQTFTTFTGADSRMPIWIDRDGNKMRSSKYESVVIDEPFNFTGITYVLHRKGDTFKLEKAEKPLPKLALAPDLRVGKKALPFSMESLHGTKVDFPKSYEGKLVMLDFWATWCGPCIAELPNVKKAYTTWHDKGFEVLGISFDEPNSKDKVESFLKKEELPWNQIYEGKGWQTTLGEKYDVSAIPFVLLVDGDTGEILATARDLRGPGLSDFIGKQIAKKKDAAKKP